jgi:hypothetical protein
MCVYGPFAGDEVAVLGRNGIGPRPHKLDNHLMDERFKFASRRQNLALAAPLFKYMIDLFRNAFRETGKVSPRINDCANAQRVFSCVPVRNADNDGWLERPLADFCKFVS